MNGGHGKEEKRTTCSGMGGSELSVARPLSLCVSGGTPEILRAKGKVWR